MLNKFLLRHFVDNETDYEKFYKVSNKTDCCEITRIAN